MPRLRPAFLATVVLTIMGLCLLWLPILWLYGRELAEVLATQPGQLLTALPLRPIPRALFINTLLLSTFTAALALFFGAAVSSLLMRGSARGRTIGAIFVALPLALPPTLLASAYLSLTRTPPLRAAASLAAEQTLSINSIFIAAPVLALCFYPLVAFALAAARAALPVELEDAAGLFGNGWNVRTKVLWPLLAPAALAAMGLVAALAMWEMGAPDLLDVRTYSVQIYRNFSAQQNTAKAALDALPMFVLGVLCFLPVWLALRRYRSWETMRFGQSAESKTTVGTALWLGWGIILLSPLLPLAVFISQVKSTSLLWQAWDANRDVIWNTIIVATLTSLLLVCLALSLVLCWREYLQRARNLLLAFVLLPLLCAPIMLVIAMLQFYNRLAIALPEGIWQLWYDSRYGLLVAGLLTRFLPLGVLWMFEATRRLPAPLEEAAASVGASRLQSTRSVTLPLLAPSLLGLFAISWALCAGELSLSVLLNAPGGQTLPVPIFNQMHIGATAKVAALSLALFGLSGGVLALLLLAVFVRRRTNTS